MASKIITLLTDFGIEDGYVAAMKGVILGICPAARLVDVSHLVPPQDVRAGAFLLASIHPYFPEGTIHLAVVDPGVGTERRAVAIRTARSLLVGPDNGLFSLVLQREGILEARLLENPDLRRPTVSQTFHGRDIFAPAAAHLASGVPFHSLGSRCTPELAARGTIERTETEIRGEIIHIDRFGNAVSNIMRADLDALARTGRGFIINVGPHTIAGLEDTYGRVGEGRPLALIGSGEHLEIAVNLGSAASLLSIRIGDRVTVTISDFPSRV